MPKPFMLGAVVNFKGTVLRSAKAAGSAEEALLLGNGNVIRSYYKLLHLCSYYTSKSWRVLGRRELVLKQTKKAFSENLPKFFFPEQKYLLYSCN